MKRTSLFVAALLVVTTSLSAPSEVAASPAKPAGDPAEVVRQFYSEYQGLGNKALGPANEMTKLETHLTSRLRALLAKARREQAEAQRRFPDDKPPFIDGALFCSLFEGFTAFEVGKPEPSPGKATRVPVRLTYRDPADPKSVTTWSDTALVVSDEGKALIDDFELGGDWPFAQKGKVSEILSAKP